MIEDLESIPLIMCPVMPRFLNAFATQFTDVRAADALRPSTPRPLGGWTIPRLPWWPAYT